jgi:biopolymer transport protein TolR
LQSFNQQNKRRSKRYTQMSEINVTPFVDVMLVLLIVFMVTAPLLTVGIPVNLPKIKAVALTEQKEPMIITISLEGLYIGENKKFKDEESLEEYLMALSNINSEVRIYIRGDEDVSYGRVLAIFDSLRGKYPNVALVTHNP